MNILDELNKKDDEYQQLQDCMYARIDLMRKDIRYFQIALNLSKQRELLENKAARLILDNGYLKALSKSI